MRLTVTKNIPLPVVPTQRVHPFDGMSITAAVWADAHDYHWQHQKLHALLQHGVGIVAGLEVIASDPPDSSVYILPGIAMDASGNTIVVKEPLSYDLGKTADGLLHIILTYGEGRPLPTSPTAEEGSALYINAAFAVETLATLPEGQHVEIARVRRERNATLTNAANPQSPGINEIDGRYRHVVGAGNSAMNTIGVFPLGKLADDHHVAGVQRLAQALRGPLGGGQRVWVDVLTSLGYNLQHYTLLYLVAHNTFQLSVDEMTAIYNYLGQGGTVFFEACQRQPAAAAQAHRVFNEMLESFGRAMAPLSSEHEILTIPNFFPAIPAGFAEAVPALQVSDGLLINQGDYGCVWAGAHQDRPATREEVRAAHELGGNLLAFAQARAMQVKTE
jgi:hypothetical protein